MIRISTARYWGLFADLVFILPAKREKNWPLKEFFYLVMKETILRVFVKSFE